MARNPGGGVVARQGLAPGEHGSIAVLELEPGVFRARARYRDHDGLVRQVAAVGKSRDAARRALGKKLAERPQRSGPLLPGSTLRTVAEAWYERLKAEGHLSQGSLASYQQTLDSPSLEALRKLPLRKLTAGALDQFLLADAKTHPARAKRAKNVLGQILAYAVRQGLLERNPIRDIGRLPSVTAAEPRPATPDEVRRLREAALLYESGVTSPGRDPSTPIAAIIDVMLCGLRPGEALALRWEDVHLNGPIPWLSVTGTVLQLPSSIAGEGQPTVVRQDAPKTPRSRRTIDLPDAVAEVLRALPHRGELVFSTNRGTPYSPKNIARVWRSVCSLAGIHGLKQHGLRKTAATVADQALGSRAAADLLGHVDDRLTKRVYVGREASVSIARDALGSLFSTGQSGT